MQSRPPLGNTLQDRGKPIGSLAGSWPGCGQGAASLHNKRGRHSTHHSTLYHRPPRHQACQKTTAITVSCTSGVQNLNAKSGHVEDGSLRPFAYKGTHSSHFHGDASVVCRRLLSYPFAKIYRVPNAVDLFPAGNEGSDTFQETPRSSAICVRPELRSARDHGAVRKAAFFSKLSWTERAIVSGRL